VEAAVLDSAARAVMAASTAGAEAAAIQVSGVEQATTRAQAGSAGVAAAVSTAAAAAVGIAVAAAPPAPPAVVTVVVVAARSWTPRPSIRFCALVSKAATAKS
jgi:hypothetical protein